MFSKSIVVVGLLGLSLAASADPNGLKGQWKYVEMQCKSGAKAWAKLGPEIINQKIGVDLEILDSTMTMDMKTSFKYDKAYVAKNIAEIEKSRAVLVALPDSPEKTKGLAQIDDSLKMMAKLSGGYSCRGKSSYTYSVNGNLIITNIVQESSDCMGFTQSKEKRNDAEFELKGNTLTVTGVKPEDNENGTCPKGDRVTTVFARK